MNKKSRCSKRKTGREDSRRRAKKLENLKEKLRSLQSEGSLKKKLDQIKALRIKAFEFWLKASRQGGDFEAQVKTVYDAICSLKYK